MLRDLCRSYGPTEPVVTDRLVKVGGIAKAVCFARDYLSSFLEDREYHIFIEAVGATERLVRLASYLKASQQMGVTIDLRGFYRHRGKSPGKLEIHACDFQGVTEDLYVA